ncbi:hypothetical protein [Nostoc sp. JL33]|uniref:hypothetical protein n=1 Tax=Nostoc sp. JL33 TaxID=2815396 RepID=UPI0025F72AD2|nr:hypothetical protein [Nostoc sp. JL33]MBN3872627.1 hypothetical protein [Nostoc sp. JL33]
MRLKNWKNLLFCILLTSSGGSWCCIRVDAAESANRDIWRSQNLASRQVNYQQLLCQKLEEEAINSLCKQSSESHPLDSQMPLNLAQQTRETTQVPDTTKKSEDTQKQNDRPQLESQPSNLPISPPDSKEQLLNAPEINYSQRLERLIYLLRSPKLPPEFDSDRELGLRVRLRPLEQQPPPPTEQPVVKFKPIGYLQSRIGYFQTDNIFSSNDIPIEDGLIISGLTLASAYFPLGSKTYLNGSIDGNLIRYINQSQYDYNQVRFNLSIYQQLSQRMYGEITWSDQQLFYANNSDHLDSFKAGDRFLNENSLQLSLGRRDPLTPKLTLDSFYELNVNFADPLSRNRIINSFWVSLNYYLQKPLQVGIDYQVNFSDFTQRDREDQFHRLFGHLNYRISNTTNMNVQAGVSLGSSTEENIDFDGWFFSINYNLQLGGF